MTDSALRAFVFLLCGYAAVIAVIFQFALVRGRRARREHAAAAAVAPEISRTLVECLAGANHIDRLRELRRNHGAQVASAILGFRDSVAGSARDLLCDLTIQLGLVHDWREGCRSRDPRRRRDSFAALAFIGIYEPCRRVTGMVLEEALNHPDRYVRILAAQGLAHFDDAKLAERVFDLATRETPLGRILLAGQLRRHAPDLCHRALPEALASDDLERVAGALELIAAWERALPLAGVQPLLDHPSEPIRNAARRAASFASVVGAA